MLHKIVALLLFISVVSIQGQNTKSKKALDYFKQAETLYVKGEPGKAIELLDKAILKDSQFTDAYLLKADAYYSLQKYELENKMLLAALVIDSMCYLPAYISLGKSYFNLSLYDKAIESFKKYEVLTKGKKGSMDVENWILKAQFAKEAMGNPFKFEPKNLGNSINSPFDEYWPSLTADEQMLVFTVLVPRDTNLFKMGNLPRSTNYFQEDFYISKRDVNKPWQYRQRMQPPLNTDGNEGAQTLSADGNWLFFTGCNRPDGKGSCDIYFSSRTATGWSEPVNVGGQVNSPYWESQPSFSADGRTLYFVSNRAGGMGGKDIWMAQMVTQNADGVPIFGKITNLGSNINTKADENSPFIHPDTKTLYFSSDGWPSMGQMDVFLSRLDKFNNWSKALNLGYPINTSSDEVGFIVNAKGDMAYYSSDGVIGGLGGKDIYYFEVPTMLRPSPISYLKGCVYDSITKQPIGASFELLRLKDGQLEMQSKAEPYDGNFLLCLPPNQQYALNVAHPGYLFHSESFNLLLENSLDVPQLIKIPLMPIQVGASLVLKNVFFASNSVELQDESRVELDKLVLFLEQNGSIVVELQGHTDNVGTAAFNLNLSTQRAKSVADYLVLKGVASNRLKHKGYGFSKPVADNTTELGRAKNRRTEMVIISK